MTSLFSRFKNERIKLQIKLKLFVKFDQYNKLNLIKTGTIYHYNSS